MEPTPLAIDLEDVEAWVTEKLEAKLEAGGMGHLRVQPGSFEWDGEGVNTKLVVCLSERPKPEPVRPKVLTLADLLGDVGAAVSLTLPPAPAGVASRKVYVAPVPDPPTPFEPEWEEEEPPPLRVLATDPNEPILYNAPPQVTDADRIAFERLQAAGIVAAHLTPELMASSSRDDVKDGVGEELANGHVQGSVAPAGHPDDPYKRKRWRQKQSDIRDEVAGILSN